MTNQNSYTKLFELIDNQTTVLTPNRRLSATLHKLYQQHQIEQKNYSWLTPDILPVSTWIERLWHHYTATQFDTPPILLNTVQEQFLWESILLNAKESAALLQASETADIAKTAWNLLKQWQIELHHPLFASAEDYAALHQWAKQFLAVCRENNWIDAANLPDAVLSKIKSNAIKPPAKIILIGFTELSPQLKCLLDSCQQIGSHLHQFDGSEKQAECVRIALPDEENEILTMARWAKSTLNQHKNVTIGCVIPSLDKKRDRVMQIFSEVFAVEPAYTADQEAAQFNISAGKSLANYPIIHTALQLLSLHKKSISVELLNYLLASPFIGEAERERIRRANFDSLLRQKNITTIDLVKAIQNTEDSKLSLSKNCPHLAKRFQQFFAQIETQEKTLTHSQWAKLFTELLSTLGWPGERSLSSEEYQIVENWLKLLSEYATLDHVSKSVSFHQGVQTLTAC